MSGIVEPDDSFDFDKLLLASPTVAPGGSHFIKFALGDKPLYIQPPNCLLKNGIVKTGKRFYCDLMFTNVNANFIRWMENLENYSRKVIFANRQKWFETELEEHDIENSFAPSLKLYKSGKYYIVRIHIPTVLGKTNMKMYDENENLIDSEHVKDDANIATILEIQGIKCSPRMFQIEMEMKQLLVLKPVDIFDKCLFKVKKQEVVNNSGMSIEEEFTSPVVEEPTIVEEPIVLDNSHHLEEFTLDIDAVPIEDSVILKKRDDVYYKMYREALQKARTAKELALTSYLEAKHIKNTYMLTDLEDDDDSD